MRQKSKFWKDPWRKLRVWFGNAEHSDRKCIPSYRHPLGPKPNPMDKPPGPKGLPLLRNLLAYEKNPAEFVTKMARTYGDIVYFKLGFQRIYQLNHPDYIREVLMVQAKNFDKTGLLQRAKRIWGNGLVSSNGSTHRAQRKLIQPIFHPDHVMPHWKIIVQYAAEAAQSWKDRDEVDLVQAMLDITLRITAKILLGLDLNTKATHQIAKDLTIIFEHFTWLFLPFSNYLEFLPLPNVQRFAKAKARMDVLIMNCILERRRVKDKREDMLSVLLNLTDDKGEAMTTEQIRSQVMTLFLAGHETIATALTWTFYCLAQNPEVRDKLQSELGTVLGGRTPEVSDLPQLEYTKRVLSESMRLYPPIWNMTRQANEDFKINGFTIPKGSLIGISQYVMHRHPKYFPDPLRFDPDRWLPENQNLRPAFTYFPFGAGARSCIGEYLGWMEGILILASLAQSWRVELLENKPPVLQPLISLKPKHGIKVRLIREVLQPIKSY